MNSEEDTLRKSTPHARVWERPVLREVGRVGAVMQGGGGKLSTSNADPGDPRKPQGQT